jgi:hypothetical protein
MIMNTPKYYLAACLFTISMMITPGFVSFNFAQTTLMSESFEAGGAIPAGWAIETVHPGNAITVVTTSSWPPGYTAYDGTYFVKFNSFEVYGGVMRLKHNLPVSTIGFTNVSIDFAWLESIGYSERTDRVDVQWSTDGTTWATAGTFNRYNPVQGWKIRSQALPAAAEGQPNVYIAFLFTSAYGNDCYLDFTHITAAGPPPPATITVGTGIESCNYPYTTYWMAGRTQLIYTAAGLIAAGALPGEITTLGFNVSSNSPQTMQNFNIKMMNTSLPALTGWVTGLQDCYSGTYAVPGTGWQMITLQTPFTWTGDNILLEICFGSNGSYSSYSYVYGSTAPTEQIQPYWMDYAAGCSFSGSPFTGFTALPNLRFMESAFTGHLKGVVTSCYNNAPLSGVNVTCGSVTATTNAAGAYMLYNIPTGTYTATYTLAGSLPGILPETVISTGLTSTKNICLNPVPGYLSGIITSAATGNPIIGARVTVGTSVGYSTGPNGAYTVQVFPVGTLSAYCSKAGFDLTSAGPYTFTLNNTITQNFALLENVNPPNGVTANLNPGQTAMNIAWNPPNGNYELLYDDGTQDAFQIWAYAGSFNAVKFSAPGYPCTLIGGKINIGASTSYASGGNPFIPCQILVYDATGPGGSPGTQIAGPFEFTPNSFGWNTFTFSSTVAITGENFYLVHKQGGNNPNAAGIAIDSASIQLRSCMRFMPSGGWMNISGNFMLRAHMNGPGGPAPLMLLNPAVVDDSSGIADNANIATGYQVWRLLQGQEGTPGSWVSIATPVVPAAVDNSWPTLPCNVYRWAVKTQYTGNRWSDAAFSNAAAKCMTAVVAVNVGLSCSGASSLYTNIKLQNTVYPDTIYQAIMGGGGTFIFPQVRKGTYSLVISKFGYDTYYQVPVTIMDNITLNATLLQSKTPATNLQINNQSLVATWNSPRLSLPIFTEDWSSGSFGTNGWVTGGTNWLIPSVGGNPSPSAMFSYNPQVSNYNQYLTSADITGQHSAFLTFKYDIYLSNSSASNTDHFSVEIWNSNSWVVLKTYSNGADIPWTSETLDISAYTHNVFRIRFHAYGTNSGNINNWKVDNISVTATGVRPDPCVQGYAFYLNTALLAIVSDTSYTIPGGFGTYGQPLAGCARALYGSGSSIQICNSVTSHFLCPPTNLAATITGNTANLSWVKPFCPMPLFKSSGMLNLESVIEPPGADSPLSEAGLSGYNVYRSQAGLGGPWVLIQHLTNPDLLNTTDLNLPAGQWWYKVTAFYDLTLYGYPGQQGESLPPEPKSVTILSVPINQTVQNSTIGNGQSSCFDATQTITIAGGSTSFTVQTGGSVTMVAGQNILYLPTTKIYPGGYMHGYITTTSSYCGSKMADGALAGGEEEPKISPAEKSFMFKIYPNPTMGNFILELDEALIPDKAIVEIYDMMGSRILVKNITGEKKNELSLSGEPAGVYFVRILYGRSAESAKIVKQ